MNIEVVSVGDQAEHVYIEKCSRAALNKDLSNVHVLAQYRDTTLYFTTDRKCTYDSFLYLNNQLLFVMSILNKNDLACMHSKLIYDHAANNEYSIEMVYEYVNYALDCYFSKNQTPPT